MKKYDILDSKILKEDNTEKYNPAVGALLVELAEIRYDKPDYGNKLGSMKRYKALGFPHIAYFEDKKTDTQSAVVYNEDSIVCIWRGTENDLDWANNLNFWAKGVKGMHAKREKKEQLKKENKLTTTVIGGKAHQGHYRCMLSVADKMIEFIKGIPNWQSLDIFSTGHSLGGSLSGHFGGYADHILNFEMVYCEAGALLGNKKYIKAINKQLGKRIWFVENNADIVCKVPLHILGFRRTKHYAYITAWGKIQTKGAFFLFRGLDLLWGTIQAPFSKKKGPIDNHHPAYYYNLQAKAAGCMKRLKIWLEYRKKDKKKK